jgi:hypothetical protein
MSHFVVDVEADGPAPGVFNMVCFGVIRIQKDLENAPTFYGLTAPTSRNCIPEALAVSGISRAEHLSFPDPIVTMMAFEKWIKEHNEKGRPVFVSDNPAWDYQWINYHFAACGIDNPFGHSGRRIGDFYAGLEKDWGKQSTWKKFRRTLHTHNPVDDARGNAEALLEICNRYNLKPPY